MTPPAAGGVTVFPNTIEITFSEAIVLADTYNGEISVASSTGSPVQVPLSAITAKPSVQTTLVISTAGLSALVKTDEAANAYTIKVANGAVVDTATPPNKYAVAGGFASKSFTLDLTPPAVLDLAEKTAQGVVPFGLVFPGTLTLRFSEKVALSTVPLRLYDGASVIDIPAAAVGGSGTTSLVINMRHASMPQFNAVNEAVGGYEVRVHADAVKDAVGHSMALAWSQSFTLDLTGPSLQSWQPSQSESFGVSFPASFKLVFSEAITLVTSKTLQLHDGAGVFDVPAAAMSGLGTTTVTLDLTHSSMPSQLNKAYEGVAGYEIRVPVGSVQDASLNPCTVAQKVPFALDLTRPTWASMAPVAGSTLAAFPAVVDLVFSEAIALHASYTGEIKIKASSGAAVPVPSSAITATGLTTIRISTVGLTALVKNDEGADAYTVEVADNSVQDLSVPANVYAVAGGFAAKSFTLDLTPPTLLRLSEKTSLPFGVLFPQWLTLIFSENVRLNASVPLQLHDGTRAIDIPEAAIIGNGSPVLLINTTHSSMPQFNRANESLDAFELRVRHRAVYDFVGHPISMLSVESFTMDLTGPNLVRLEPVRAKPFGVQFPASLTLVFSEKVTVVTGKSLQLYDGINAIDIPAVAVSGTGTTSLTIDTTHADIPQFNRANEAANGYELRVPIGSVQDPSLNPSSVFGTAQFTLDITKPRCAQFVLARSRIATLCT